MDLTRNILYRGFYLNEEDIGDNITPGDPIGGGITGSVVDSVDFSDVDVVQFMEKRSQSDGMDAGQPFQGARRIHMSGTLYATTRNLLYDKYLALRAALNPVLAYLDEPGDKGFQPLYFSIPTNDVGNFPAGAIDLMVYAVPRALECNFQRDVSGGDDGDSLALPWQATLVCRDPGIYHDTPVDVDITADIADDWGHRGNYPSPLNILIVLGTTAGSFFLVTGGVMVNITLPAGTAGRILRYKGADKVVTLEENDVEVPRMDLLGATASAWPLISPGTGTNPFDASYYNHTPGAGSHMWFYEQWA